MKHFNHMFTDDDILTLTCTLTALPLIHMDGVSETQQSINDACCKSALEKLINHQTDIIPNETKVIAVSLIAADMILKGELEVDSSIRELFVPYRFSINRLRPIFEEIFI
ncbi:MULTISPECIES: hypothetical protein [Bacteria]|uniref:Uncharacterized protein n=3 Tax=Bacteria TaxID=2 RepID=N9Z4I5_9FIRM|nr:MULTISPECIES: hypothetical protein [Bacteria]ENZ34600.1 hypothetical protein HMPREF1097_03987 [Enterocloster bolteae 90B8]